MIKSFAAIVIAFLLNNTSTAQVHTTEAVPFMDTTDILNELKHLLAADSKPVSYTTVELAIGNRLFSMQNNRLNSKQSNSQTTVYSPSVGYNHKSGFSIYAGANFLKDSSNRFDASQYSLTGGYDLQENKTIDLGIYYTHYFVRDTYSPYASPVSNDLYATLMFKKTWLRPGIALGYATGMYNQVRRKDTTAFGLRRDVYDSATIKLRSFSAILSVNHRFEWNKIFKQDDGLAFTTSIMLNIGTSISNISHKTNAGTLLNFLNRKGKLPKFQSTPIQAESIGMNLNLNYGIGNFNINPQLYIDYYLPKENDTKFSQIFTINFGYSF